MTSPACVVVAIPAHDEEEVIGACLATVLAAVRHARAEGEIAEARVAVVAHACADGTGSAARAALQGEDAIGIVVWDDASRTIADVRRGAVAAAMAEAACHAADTWVFNTDADSLVPPDWITGMLGTVRREGALAAAGMVEVWDWEAPEAARAEYARMVAAGIHGDTHEHVYGANLVVRLDAYLEVGGFERLDHGEDHRLVQRLREAGHRVATPLAPVVRTSGRITPRCPDGLGALLARLSRG